MLRSFKILAIATAALTAGGVVGVSSAAAEFHCAVESCSYTLREDGTLKTGHQVFIVQNSSKTESVSFTCGKVSGKDTFAPKTSFWARFAMSYETASCVVNGSPGVEIVMNGCEYQFSDLGHVSILGCTAAKKIEVKITGGCVFTVGEQNFLSGIKYHTIGSAPSREVTVEADVPSISVTATAACESLIKTKQTLYGHYTTGNAIITGEAFGGVMTDAWFT